jgi:hypothetical protein
MSLVAKRDQMIERKHVVVETDGFCFRVVEIATVAPSPSALPSVRDTEPGDGTRWICEGD